MMTHYDVLEVSPKASAEVIRAAYKSLMQRYHPDKNSELADTGKDAARITQAYEVLGDAGKRAGYDLELAAAGSAASGVSSAGSGRARPATAGGRSRPPADPRSWLAWLVIACIIVAGSIILLQSRKPARSSAVLAEKQNVPSSPAAGAVAIAPPQAAASAVTAESAADLQARSVPSFATSLRIDLVSPDRASTAPMHVLQIPELGFRVDAPDAVRWAKKIEALRGTLLQQVLARLSIADYEQLIGVNGDLYLKRFIATAVLDGIAYEDTSPPPPPPLPGVITPPPLPPVAVLLPQSFSVR
jgi:hypothetical protein